MANQHVDGSWGLWGGTVEETAYALLILATCAPPTRGMRAAVARGDAYLQARWSDAGLANDPALWHDKDLYRPDAIITAAVLAAMETVRRRLPDTVTG
jgi:hypothetical protein